MTRDLTQRMLVAVEVRMRLHEQRIINGPQSTNGTMKARVRLNETTEILGILRNVVKAHEQAERQP